LGLLFGFVEIAAIAFNGRDTIKRCSFFRAIADLTPQRQRLIGKVQRLVVLL
jgi:hypothetical protein